MMASSLARFEQERIQIMQSLASTAPAVSQSQHAQMPSMPAASQSLPHASYPPVEDLSGNAQGRQ